jgi:DUF1365 family protein
VETDFEFDLDLPDERLQVTVRTQGCDESLLTASLTGTRHALTDSRLRRLTLRYPLVTLRVIVLIHWHALRLWLRRVPWFSKARRPDQQTHVLRPHRSLTSSPTPKAASSSLS